jgi:hypothetical protein
MVAADLHPEPLVERTVQVPRIAAGKMSHGLDDECWMNRVKATLHGGRNVEPGRLPVTENELTWHQPFGSARQRDDKAILGDMRGTDHDGWADLGAGQVRERVTYEDDVMP